MGTENGIGFGAGGGATRGNDSNVLGEYTWTPSIWGKTLLLLRAWFGGGVLGLAGDGTLGMGPLPAFGPKCSGIVINPLKLGAFISPRCDT